MSGAGLLQSNVVRILFDSRWILVRWHVAVLEPCKELIHAIESNWSHSTLSKKALHKHWPGENSGDVNSYLKCSLIQSCWQHVVSRELGKRTLTLIPFFPDDLEGPCSISWFKSETDMRFFSQWIFMSLDFSWPSWMSISSAVWANLKVWRAQMLDRLDKTTFPTNSPYHLAAQNQDHSKDDVSLSGWCHVKRNVPRLWISKLTERPSMNLFLCSYHHSGA